MTLAQVKQAITEMSERERCELNAWLQQWSDDAWDDQMVQDASTGKLDALVREAEIAHRQGLSKKFP